MAFLKPIHKSTATPRALKYLFLNLGILGGAPAVTYYFFGPEIEKFTIRQQIAQSNRTILNESAQTWGVKLHVYNSSSELQHKLADKVKNVRDLKKWCKETLDKESTHNDYSSAEKLCTTPTNKEKLERFNWRIIESADNYRWGKKAEWYNTSKSKDIETAKSDKISSEEIRQWCESVAEKEIKEGDKIYESTKRWCTRRNWLVQRKN